ncbi:unnamed protein product [Rotaria sp. Silwood1]|nr:unnamed protein product [Rotaria sp. Silwood1]CAF3790230.1 unnamed protein product [Rotaria sp. Silwood1]
MSDLFNSSDNINLHHISPHVYVELNKIMNDMLNQLFFDKDLPYEHLMFLLNHRNTIETKFIELLNQRIEQLNIDHNIRNRLITNIDKLSSYLLDINADTNINQIFHFNYDSDEESYVDYPSDDMNSEEYDSYDDIENQIIDQIELESGVTVWFFNARRNQHEHTSDDDSN